MTLSRRRFVVKLRSKSKISRSQSFKMLSRLFVIAGNQRKFIAIAIFLTILQSLFTALQPYIYKLIIDEVILVGQFGNLMYWCLGLVVWLIIQATLAFSNSYLAENIAQNVIIKLRQYVYEHLTKLRLSFFDKTAVGTAVTRSVSDIQTITDLFASGIITILGDIIQILAILTCMIYINWKLTIFTILVIPLLLYAANFFRKGVRDSFQEVRNQVSILNAFLQERITGMPIVQLFNREGNEYSKFKDINAKHRNAHFKSIFYYSIFFPIVEILVALAFAIIISYGSVLLFKKQILLGEVTAFIMFVNLFFRPIRAIADRFNNIQMGLVSAERIFKLIDDKDFVEDSGTLNPDKIQGKIEFKDVWFAYNDAEWIIKGISFTVNPGQSLAIIGSTGSGKTSIANLLTQLYPHQKGDILIDNRSVKEYIPSELRKKVAFVLQDVFLFSGSIRSNLVLKNENMSTKVIESVAKEIGAYEFIDALPGGFEFNVSERGMSLSQGQRQLISFIRALAIDPDIIILDEATSSIDSQTEELIQKAISLLLSNRTAIVIAHRLSTIKNCDDIMVLNQGKIVEMGSHNNLLAKKGSYFELYQTQIKANNFK